MVYDIVVIGGGINGVGIALDATSRGLNVLLCEKNDLGSGTSSKSSKLIHGGLRYLEQYAFKLVKESLNEREILLKNAGHLVQPLPFVIPFDKTYRSHWMIRLGLHCYDFLNVGSSLRKSKSLKLKIDSTNPLKHSIKNGFQYYDCTVDDARLVVSVARLAKSLGATLLTRTPCTAAQPTEDNLWSVTLKPKDQTKALCVKARVVVNATGPWLTETLAQVIKRDSAYSIKKVKGSHLILPKLYEGNQAYLLQNKDGRVVFVLPFLKQFTMVGTTDLPYFEDPSAAHIDEKEIHYLCQVVNDYFHHSIKPSQIYASWSGVRALWDDGSLNLSSMTRDCKIETKLNASHPPVINIFGGKLTTYRSLSEKTIDSLKPVFPDLKKSKTRAMKLPGALPYQVFSKFLSSLIDQYPFVPAFTLERFARSYGLESHEILHHCKQLSDLGQEFGHGLTEREVLFLLNNEFAQNAEDILLRRTKLGLLFQAKQIEVLDNWIHNQQSFGFELDNAVFKHQ